MAIFTLISSPRFFITYMEYNCKVVGVREVSIFDSLFSRGLFFVLVGLNDVGFMLFEIFGFQFIVFPVVDFC